MEKFAKSVEVLRSYLADKIEGEKKDEKILHLTLVTDFVCEFNESRLQEFSQVLATVVEIVLIFCGDSTSDVRSNAAECLERISKAKVNFLFKILANIFKEVKRCDNPRSLKCALNHIAELMPYLQPQKFQIIQASFGPEICRLAANENEAILETLPGFVDKVYSVVGCGLTQKDVNTICAPFFENLASKSAVKRRAAALTIYHVARHSAFPVANTLHCMKNIFLKILPLNVAELDSDFLVGSLNCIRHLLTVFDTHKEGVETQNATSLLPMLVLCFEMFCELCQHSSSVVTTAALEALLSLVRVCPPGFKQILTRKAGVPRVQIFDPSEEVLTWSPTEFVPSRGSISSGIESMSNLEDASSDVPLFTNKLANRSVNASSSSAGDAESITASSNRLGSSNSSSVEDLPEKIRTLTSKNEDEDDDDFEINAIKDSLDYSVMTESMYANDIPNYDAKNSETAVESASSIEIGSYTSTLQTPAVYAMRLIASHFLLFGEKSKLCPDKKVRVSIKSLALQILAQLCAIENRKDLNLMLSVANSNSESQSLDDVFLFMAHFDPQIRSGCVQIYGSLLKSILDCCCLDVSMFRMSIEQVLKCLSDSEAPVARAALSVLTTNVRVLLETCPDSALVADVVESVLFLKTHKYWLVKLSALEFVQNIDFSHLMYHETNYAVLGTTTKLSLQKQILDFILEQLASSHQSIRESASTIMVSLVPKICTPQACTVSFLHDSLVNSSIDLHQNYCPVFKPISEIYCVEKTMKFQNSYARVEPKETQISKISQKLSFIVHNLFRELTLTSDSVAVNGLLQTIHKLVVQYCPVDFPESWQASSVSDKLDSKFGCLNFCLNLLNTSSCSNVVSHAYLIDIITSLLTAASVSFLEKPEVFDDTSKVLRDWPAISDDTLASLFGVFFHHLLKCLNIIDHVLRGKEPASSPVKTNYPKLPANLTSLPSYFPNTPNIPSPIRKKGQKFVESAVTKARNTSATLPSFPTKLLEEAKKDTVAMFSSPAPVVPTSPKPLDATFSHDSNLMQLFELLTNMNKTLKVSSLTNQSDKFIVFTSSVLKSVGCLFQYASTREISLYVDVILRQVELCLNLTPVEAIQCVQHLFHSVFGTSICHLASPNLRQQSPFKQKRDNRDISFLFTSTFTDPYMQFTQQLAPDADPNGDPNVTNLKREIKLKSGPVWQFQNRMSLVNQHIKSFETLVLNSLRKYSSSSRNCDRLVVIELLCQLINLRVNYNLLDNEHSFLKFLTDQLNVFSELRGQVSDSHAELTGHAMTFFIQLSHQKFEGAPIVYLEKVTQHCSALSEVDNKTSLHVLRPVVHDLFARRGISVSDPEEQSSTTANRLETSGSTAARQIVSVLLLQLSDYPEAWDLLIVALRHARHEGDLQHKTFSRQCSDNLVPLLENGEVVFESVLDVDRLQQILSLLHTSLTLPNSENLLRLFFKTPPTDSFRNFRNFLSISLSLICTMCRNSQDDSLLSRVKELKSKIVSDSSPIFKCTKPEDMIANQYLLIISCLNEDVFDFDLNSLHQHIHKLFQYLQFIIKSSSPFAKKVAESFAKLINGAQVTHVLSANVITLNEKLKRLLVNFHPYLFLQWCDILFSVGYTRDQSWWPSILNSDSSNLDPRKEGGPNRSTTSPSEAFLTKSCFLLLIDSAVATACKDVEPMSWAILNHLKDICTFAEEPPVVDFLSTVYLNPALSALLAQKLFEEELLHSIMYSNSKFKCLAIIKALHPTVSHKVVLLLCGNEIFINNPNLVVQRAVVNIAVAKFQHLINSTTCEQVPLQELNLIGRKLLRPMAVYKRFPELTNHIARYFQKFASKTSEYCIELRSLTVSELSVDNFDGLDAKFSKSFLERSREIMTDEVHAKFVLAFQVSESKAYLSSFDVKFDLLLAVMQQYMTEKAQNNVENEELISSVFSIFIQNVEKLEFSNIARRFNSFLNCFDYYVLLDPGWAQKLTPQGQKLLQLVERQLEIISLKRDAVASFDLRKLVKFIPFVTVLTQTMDKCPFSKCLKVCKLLMLVTRNLLPSCFSSLKVSQKDDAVVTARESIACALLLHKENPSFEFAHSLKQALLAFCRNPEIVEICRMPEEMWVKGFSVESTDQKPANIDTSYLIDPEIFFEFQTRIELLGWTSRQSFEEIWMIYLSVLNLSNEDEIEDLEEKWKIRKMSFNAIINLVAVAMRTLVPGNPTVEAPCLPNNSMRNSNLRSGRRVAPEIHYQNIAKLKRGLTFQYRGVIKSSSVHFAELLTHSMFVNMPDHVIDHVRVDLNSCVVLLNEQCHHWLTDHTIPTSVTCDVFKGLILLSNLFVDTNQFDWLYVLISNLHRSLPAEDELTALYTIPLLCQSINATTDIERHSEEIEHLISIFVAGLNSSMLSIETTTLCGLSLLMKCADKNKSILRPIVSNHLQMYILNRITAATSVAASRPSRHYMLSLVALTFDTITNFISDLRESDFVSTAVQMLLVYSSICTKNVFCAIFTRIDELVISQALNRKVADYVIKTCFEHIKNSSTQTTLRFSFSIFLSCIYSYYPPAVHNVESDENLSIDSIERVTRIIEKFELTSPQHAKVIIRPLARLMVDYLNLQARFYKATSLMQKHRNAEGQCYSVYLVFDIFQDLLHCDSEKVLLDLLWPALPSIVSQLQNHADACNTLSLMMVSAIKSPFSEAMIGQILNQFEIRANYVASKPSANQIESYRNSRWIGLVEKLTMFTVQVFFNSLDCELDRVQFRESLAASNVKFVKELLAI